MPPHQPHSVDLTSPDVVVMVQVLKSAAALALLRDYTSLRKYNLRCVVSLVAELNVVC